MITMIYSDFLYDSPDKTGLELNTSMINKISVLLGLRVYDLLFYCC